MRPADTDKLTPPRVGGPPAGGSLSYAELDAQLSQLEYAITWELTDFTTSVEQLARLADASGSGNLIARTQLLLANLARCRGDLPEAISIIGEVRAWAVEHSDDLLTARCHNALATIFRSIGDRAGSLEHAVQSLELSGPDTPTWMRINHLLWLGVALAFNRSREASVPFDEALELSLSIDDPALHLNMLNNTAYSMYEIGELDSALRHVNLMETMVDGLTVEQGVSYFDTIGRIALEVGDHDRVERHLAATLYADETLLAAEADGLPAALLTLAESRRKRGDLGNAQKALSRCRDLVDRRGLFDISAAARREQAALYAASGAYRDAYAELVRADQEATDLHDASREFRAQVAHANYEFTETRKARDQFRDLAWRDPLTGLHNRRFLDVELPRLVRSCVAASQPLSVAILDLDHFKRVNDTLSHQVGDGVLCQAAQVMVDQIRDGARVVRLGGEEFVLLLPGVDHPTALAECDEIRRALEFHTWHELAEGLAVTASIGITTSGSLIGAAAVLSNADRNLYSAKRAGRNRVVGDPD